MRTIFAAIFLGVAAIPAFANETTGVVAAFDRVDMILVLEDNTIWNLAANQEVPENLRAGETITIVFNGSENGVDAVTSITRVEN